MISSSFYLILSAVLFTIGVVGVLTRRNAVVVLMCIELMLNSVNLTFVAFSRYLSSMAGQALTLPHWNHDNSLPLRRTTPDRKKDFLPFRLTMSGSQQQPAGHC